MSRLQLVGIAFLACGAISGFATGGPFGLILASVCLIVGLVMVVASEARRAQPEAGESSRKMRARVMLAIKDVHARPHQGGRFSAIHDPDQPDLELEVFLKCWLVNETAVPLNIETVQLELKASDGSSRLAEPVHGDIENWQLGALQEEWETWDMRLRVAMEDVSELDTTVPLECGLVREGWLHFRFRNVTPAEFRSEPLQISLTDSLSHVHVATAPEARHLPGRIWPVLATGAAAGSPSPGIAAS